MNLFKESLCVMFSFFVITGCISKNVGTRYSVSLPNSKDIVTVKSKELKSMVITPHMEEEIKERQNFLYCSTFQLAWNEFRDRDSTYLPDKPEVVKLLDKKLSTKEDISEDCYVARAGTWKNVVDEINKELKVKFGKEAWLLTKERVLGDRFSESAFLAYAFLFKNLMFKKEFENLEHPLYFYWNEESEKVKAFGIKKYSPDKKKHRALGKQVSILDYKNDSDFIISLSSKSRKDEIILAKIPPQKTLLEIIKTIEKRISKSNLDYLKKDETLKIPKIDFDIEHSYPELAGYFSQLAMGPAKAVQRTRFKFSEKGVILKSEAVIKFLSESRMGRGPLPRRFVFNKPFLIYLKEKGGKYPYFAMWVGNPELLVKATE